MLESLVLRGSGVHPSARYTSQAATESINMLKATQPLVADSKFLILCTSTPDFPLPTTACIVQEAVDFQTSTAAFDLRGGAETFISAITLASGMIRSGSFSGATIASADVEIESSESDRIRATASWLSTAGAEKFRCGASVYGRSGVAAHELALLAASELFAGAGVVDGQRWHVLAAGVDEANVFGDDVRRAMSSVGLTSLVVSKRRDVNTLPESLVSLRECQNLQQGDLVMLVAVSDGSVAYGLVLEW